MSKCTDLGKKKNSRAFVLSFPEVFQILPTTTTAKQLKNQIDSVNRRNEFFILRESFVPATFVMNSRKRGFAIVVTIGVARGVFTAHLGN